MKRLLLTFSLILGIVALPVAVSSSVGAVDPYGPCSDSGNSGNTVCKAKGETGTKTLIQNVINLLLMIAGIIAVIMIIIGGIRYATSAGDSNTTKSAMNTILYSVIGLVISIFAYAIVQYVYTFFYK